MRHRLAPARGVFGIVAVLIIIGGCRAIRRCATCGMKVDPGSPWVSLVTIDGKDETFDTPSCAFAAWRKARTPAAGARFREYYSQELTAVQQLRFVRGSDVIGPMGPDLVPVDAAAAARFARDHNGAPPQSADQLLQGEAE